MRQTKTYFLIFGLLLLLFSCEEEIGESLATAQLKLEEGKAEEALAIADSLLEVDANNMDAVLLGAMALYAMEDYAQSIYYLGEFLQARSTDADGFLLRAKNYRAIGKEEAAHSDLEAAVKYDPYLDEAVEMLLFDYYQDNNWKSWLERLWDLEKKGYHQAGFLGMCSIRGLVQGKYGTAKDFAKQAIDQAPGGNMEYYSAMIHLELGEPQKALNLLEQTKANPMHGGSVSFLEGMAYLQMENYHAVDRCLAELRKEDRGSEAGYLEGRKLMRQGELFQALDSVTGSEMEEIQRKAMVQFIEAELEVGLFGSDDVYIESGNPFYVESLAFNAFWNLKAGWIEEARDIVGEALKLNPEHPFALFVQGCIKVDIQENWIKVGSEFAEKGADVGKLQRKLKGKRNAESIETEMSWENENESDLKKDETEEIVEKTTGCEDLQHAIDNKLGVIYGEKYEQEAIKLCK